MWPCSIKMAVFCINVAALCKNVAVFRKRWQSFSINVAVFCIKEAVHCKNWPRFVDMWPSSLHTRRGPALLWPYSGPYVHF